MARSDQRFLSFVPISDGEQSQAFYEGMLALDLISTRRSR